MCVFNSYWMVVLRSPLFPITGLMLHGIVAGMVGESFARGLDEIPSITDFAHEVFTYFGMGTSLQELYFSPEQVPPAAWDCVATAAKWARLRADVLRDSHWIGGDPELQEAYGFASASPELGIVTLRNPSLRKHPVRLTVESVLQFDTVETDGFYNYPLIRRFQGSSSSEKSSEKSSGHWSRWRGIEGTASPQIRVRCIHANPEHYDIEKEFQTPKDHLQWNAVAGDCLRGRATLETDATPNIGIHAADSKKTGQRLVCVSAEEEKVQLKKRSSSIGASSTGVAAKQGVLPLGYCLVPSWTSLLSVEFDPFEAVVLEFEPHVAEHRDQRQADGSAAMDRGELAQFPVRPYAAMTPGHGGRNKQQSHVNDDVSNTDVCSECGVALLSAVRASQVFAKELGTTEGGHVAWNEHHKATGHIGTPLVSMIRLSRPKPLAGQVPSTVQEAAQSLKWNIDDIALLQQALCWSNGGKYRLSLQGVFVLVADQKVAQVRTTNDPSHLAWLQLELEANPFNSPLELTLEKQGNTDADNIVQWLDEKKDAYIRRLVATSGTNKPGDSAAPVPVDLLWEVALLRDRAAV